jgi:hypothetical protein
MNSIDRFAFTHYTFAAAMKLAYKNAFWLIASDNDTTCWQKFLFYKYKIFTGFWHG